MALDLMISRIVELSSYEYTAPSSLKYWNRLNTFSSDKDHMAGYFSGLCSDLENKHKDFFDRIPDIGNFCKYTVSFSEDDKEIKLSDKGFNSKFSDRCLEGGVSSAVLGVFAACTGFYVWPFAVLGLGFFGLSAMSSDGKYSKLRNSLNLLSEVKKSSDDYLYALREFNDCIDVRFKGMSRLSDLPEFTEHSGVISDVNILMYGFCADINRMNYLMRDYKGLFSDDFKKVSSGKKIEYV